MTKSSLKVGIVVPHIFMQDVILKDVIFSPGFLARDLAEGIQKLGVDVTLYSPGHVTTSVTNVTADLSYFDTELAGRGYGYMELLKKHPGTYITLARQVQAELVAKAYADANNGDLDVVHIYTNEEELALPFAQFCSKPVVFTHHDPFNFLIKYKNIMPKYSHLPWISMSYAQRKGMPEATNWIGNVYHGVAENVFTINSNPGTYFTYFGRIIEAKGVHLAIKAVQLYNTRMRSQNLPIVPLKIAGKHYAETSKDTYWQEQVQPLVDGKEIIYEGFISSDAQKQQFLGNALANIAPSIFDEPFGMVMIESLACGNPVVGLDSGAISEVVKDGQTGFVVPKTLLENGELNEDMAIADVASALEHVRQIDRRTCRQDFEMRFTLDRMCQEHIMIYKSVRSQLSTHN